MSDADPGDAAEDDGGVEVRDADPEDAGSVDAPGESCAEDCGAQRVCFAGRCRNECPTPLWCRDAESGPVCREGACVECVADDDCGSDRFRCDLDRFECVPRPYDTSITQFGILYHTWHCRAADARPIRNMDEIRDGRGSWGPPNEFHWWDEPAVGYYCPSRDDEVLRAHAEQLRDAGVDFIVLVGANHAYVDARSDDTPGMVLRPLERLLSVWSTVRDAPRVVPWVPLVAAERNANVYTVDAMLQRLATYPAMHFEHEGKPLLLLVDNEVHSVDAVGEARLGADYTVRRMGSGQPAASASWSYMERCASPTGVCGQRLARRGDDVEQIAVSFAYQGRFGNTTDATPKHRGFTFRRQFERVFEHPEVPIVILNQWNEWVTQRQVCGGAACPCASYPTGCAYGPWDAEYGRDAEPSRSVTGDYYYRLMRSCVRLLRAGQSCARGGEGVMCCGADTE